MSPVRARRFLHVSGFIRAMAASTAGVTMGGFLAKLDAHGAALGLVVSAGLAGRRRALDVPTRQSYVMAVVEPPEERV